MYLSKLILNPRCRDARRDVGSPYELHRTLAHAFETQEGIDYRQHHGVLFRLESTAYSSGLPTVLVQSLSKPNWSELPETYLLNAPDSALKSVSPSFAIGQSFAFRLVANPTKKESRTGQAQGRRIALLDEADGDEQTPARSWLQRKGEQHGFRVIYAVSEAFWLRFDRHGVIANQIPIYGVRFDGLLQVTDPDLLRTAITNGIGPGKAFGFGLLSLARPQ